MVKTDNLSGCVYTHDGGFYRRLATPIPSGTEMQFAFALHGQRTLPYNPVRIYPPCPAPFRINRVKAAVWVRRIPWWIPLAAAGLMGLGLLGLARCEDFGDGGRHYLRQQMLWAVLGMVAMLAATLPSYRRLCHWSYAIFGLAIVLLVAVYFFRSVNGAHRWVRWGHVGLQPSEFAKVAFVLVLGRYLMYRENYRRLRGLLVPLALTTLPVLLVLKEPDLGTASVFLPVLFVMLLVAGARRGDLLRVLMAGVVLLPLFWMQMSPYQKSRIKVLLQSARPGPKALGRRLPVVPGPQDDGSRRTLGKFLVSASRGPTRGHGRRTICRRTTPTSSSACWANASACRAWPWCCCFTD